jgi:hypothetical protein
MPILDLGPGGAELLAGLGSPVREATILTTLGLSATRRVAYRVDLADGRTVKLRRAATEERARCFTELAAAVGDPRLARVLARRGDVTMEEWIPGTSVDRLELCDAHLAAGAELLAAIHLADVPAGFPRARAMSTEAARAGIETALRALLDGGAVDESLAGFLRAAAAERDPRTAPAGIIHTDLCAENLVVDPGGIVRAVDNEALRIGPTGFDVARVWYRWPMSASAWATYVSAYARQADPEPPLAHFAFWKLAAVLHSARVRMRRGIGAAEVPLARLRALAGEL